MQINIPTGYMVNRDHIDAVYNQNVPGLMWVDFTDNELYFLFSHVSCEYCVYLLGAVPDRDVLYQSAVAQIYILVGMHSKIIHAPQISVFDK